MKPKQDWNLKRNQKQHCIFSTNTCIYLFQCFTSLKNAVWITQVNILKPFQFSGFIKGVPPPSVFSRYKLVYWIIFKTLCGRIQRLWVDIRTNLCILELIYSPYFWCHHLLLIHMLMILTEKRFNMTPSVIVTP